MGNPNTSSTSSIVIFFRLPPWIIGRTLRLQRFLPWVCESFLITQLLGSTGNKSFVIKFMGAITFRMSFEYITYLQRVRVRCHRVKLTAQVRPVCNKSWTQIDFVSSNFALDIFDINTLSLNCGPMIAASINSTSSPKNLNRQFATYFYPIINNARTLEKKTF